MTCPSACAEGEPALAHRRGPRPVEESLHREPAKILSQVVRCLCPEPLRYAVSAPGTRSLALAGAGGCADFITECIEDIENRNLPKASPQSEAPMRPTRCGHKPEPAQLLAYLRCEWSSHPPAARQLAAGDRLLAVLGGQFEQERPGMMDVRIHPHLCCPIIAVSQGRAAVRFVIFKH